MVIAVREAEFTLDLDIAIYGDGLCLLIDLLLRSDYEPALSRSAGLRDLAARRSAG